MTPSVELLLTAQSAERYNFHGTVAVVIDVLRATTSIQSALRSGAGVVKPVADVDAARAVKAAYPDALLCGERHGVPPEGFDMGNSPAEFRNADLTGRDLILTTTNGTLAVTNSRSADSVLAASMLNVAAASRAAAQSPRICIVCAGTGGEFSLDDFYCAGALVKAMLEITPLGGTDLVWAAAALAESPVADVVNDRTCRHVGILKRLGFHRDLEIALSDNITDELVPVFDGTLGGFAAEHRHG